DPVDQIPEDGEKPDPKWTYRGQFLDLRTLAFALTDRGYTLASAAQAFGLDAGKLQIQEHGRITELYVDYNRRDVEVTAELYGALMEEFLRHPIDLQATKAYSP